jgi:hypothetical protein
MDLGLADWLSRLGPLELVEVLRIIGTASDASRKIAQLESFG